MKSVYKRLAWTGIKKNKKLYIPYIVASVVMVMMNYIINYLALTDFTSNMFGVDLVSEVFLWGSIVVAVFSAIFLFYTNSFIMKNRKRELGLYNVLGMNKMNIGRILFWENLFIAVFSMAAGIILGMLLSKASELFMLNIIKEPVNYVFKIPKGAFISSIRIYAIIFVIIFLNSIRQIKFTSTINLLRSQNEGEKPLKGNVVIGISGLSCLVIGYGIAMTIKDPYSAIVMFFIAVLFVIAGTYLVMIFGSVLLCKCLQRNKKYYYNKKHFVTVSSMAYRMKRNGASLASICILLTMILVIISSTSSLYIGLGDILEKRLPNDYNMEYRLSSVKEMDDKNVEKLQENFSRAAKDNNISVIESKNRRVIEFPGGMIDNQMVFHENGAPRQFYAIPLDDYNNFADEKKELSGNQVFLINICENTYNKDTIQLGENVKYQVKEILGEDKSPIVSPLLLKGLIIVVPDINVFSAQLEKAMVNTKITPQYKYINNISVDASDKEQEAFSRVLTSDKFKNSSNGSYFSIYCESKVLVNNELYGMYGGFLGLGILMSLLFTASAVLIIYYKQISEGYEDKSRFELMQKIGMTKDEIKKSVNGQLIIVFLLPVILAGIHLIFAFPMLKLILKMMFLQNDLLFALVNLLCFVLCAIMYMLVYRITLKSYLRIVGSV